eukprot:scaffold18977_cov76-Skeletonema_dohrnii-CCMP3373.AAC.2
MVELDDEHTKCSICVTEFSSDRNNKDPEIRKYLPVLSSSQRCDHWFCHGCILREQLRVAEENNGRIPKWLKCMHCREKTSFNPAEPKYHRLLIDLLASDAAARVTLEEQEETTISAGTKRKTPPETAETAPEKSKSKSSKETEEGMRKSDDDDDAKKTAAKQWRGRAEAAAGPTRKSLPISATAGLKSPPEKALKGKKKSWRKRRKKDLAMIIGDEIPDDLSTTRRVIHFGKEFKPIRGRRAASDTAWDKVKERECSLSNQSVDSPKPLCLYLPKFARHSSHGDERIQDKNYLDSVLNCSGVDVVDAYIKSTRTITVYYSSSELMMGIARRVKDIESMQMHLFDHLFDIYEVGKANGSRDCNGARVDA